MTPVTEPAATRFGVSNWGSRTSEGWALNAERILTILQKGPPFPDDPWVQLWVGAITSLTYYRDCMLRLRPPLKLRIKTSWADRYKIYRSHYVFALIESSGEPYARRWCAQNGTHFYEKPIIPKNMNRGTLPF